MGLIRYKPDIRGTGELLRGPEMERMVRSAAQKGKKFAESISPRPGEAPDATGEYAASFRVSSTRAGGPRHDRAMAVLQNDSDHAVFVEVRDGYHVLARTADFIRQAGP